MSISVLPEIILSLNVNGPFTYQDVRRHLEEYERSSEDGSKASDFEVDVYLSRLVRNGILVQKGLTSSFYSVG